LKSALDGRAWIESATLRARPRGVMAARRLLVVSHPAVLAVNQLPYIELRQYGWDPYLVVPARWRHEYASGAFPPEIAPELRGRVASRRVILAGRVQRHMYLTRPGRLIDELQPEAAFLEAEITSAAAFQWSRPLAQRGIPYGVQAEENLERPWPLPARIFRKATIGDASFVASRSPTAATLAKRIRPDVPTPVISHHVPAWPQPTERSSRPTEDGFVVGFAGRLVPEKGLETLLEAVAGLDGVAVRLVGNGPERDRLTARAAELGVLLRIDTDIRHEQMASAYAGFDALVLPSRTTPTWAEQFGRVLVEAMWCGVPVIGSSSGEIPWVIDSTGGGLVFEEGNPEALRAAIAEFRDSPARRRQLGLQGQALVRETFSVEAVARALHSALLHASARGPSAVHADHRAALWQQVGNGMVT
jgi:glycosyltransferase involved in cell wall biosynthesis